ncbi:uncharacterized protein LOC129718425 [Wyeomyia smithii]|uniref:uncharacterized protein LOC129718425 n=1 Tax=Wyeomyia smithii TaxID=174621 RepID=UPI0024680888|nr:uncharacterized protein LOC129718425 [Wyeomyia smithii]XP_055525184.1 uncharacterized protein LOC129718425 [Wyeomyia smithii]
MHKHQKFNTMIAAIQQKFHIIRVKEALKKVIRKCQHCMNERAKPYAPRMAAFHENRVQPYNKPFTYTGVDYFGPYTVSIGRRTERRWEVLFTCMTTRAVFLELANNLSTDAFMICLNMLQNERGAVKHLYSDNGTNFVGAENEIKTLHHRLSGQGIEWHFIPPASPHFGGAWERLVKEVKTLLPSHTMPEHVLRGLLVETESIINNRPLTNISLDKDDDEPITPNHFLIGCNGNSALSLNDKSPHEATKQHWKRIQLYSKQLWDRWVKEYLPLLGDRTKWISEAKPLQLDDVVVMTDENQKGNFKKGVVIKLHTAKDGQVRSAIVRTSEGEYTRPAVELAALDVRRPSNDANKQETNFVGCLQDNTFFFYSRLFSVGLVPPLLWPITDAQGGDSTPRTLTHDPFINGPAPTALLPHAMEGVIPEIFRLRKSPGVG